MIHTFNIMNENTNLNYAFVTLINTLYQIPMKKITEQEVVEALKSLRKTAEDRVGKKVTQSDMAEQVGVGLRQYQNLEMLKSDISLAQFIKASHAIGLTPIEVIFEAYAQADFLESKNPALLKQLKSLFEMSRDLFRVMKEGDDGNKEEA